MKMEIAGDDGRRRRRMAMEMAMDEWMAMNGDGDGQ